MRKMVFKVLVVLALTFVLTTPASATGCRGNSIASIVGSVFYGATGGVALGIWALTLPTALVGPIAAGALEVLTTTGVFGAVAGFVGSVMVEDAGCAPTY